MRRKGCSELDVGEDGESDAEDVEADGNNEEDEVLLTLDLLEQEDRPERRDDHGTHRNDRESCSLFSLWSVVCCPLFLTTCNKGRKGRAQTDGGTENSVGCHEARGRNAPHGSTNDRGNDRLCFFFFGWSQIINKRGQRKLLGKRTSGKIWGRLRL